MKLSNFFALCLAGTVLSLIHDAVLAQNLYVREIRVSNENDGSGALEVEVHMYWRVSQDTVRFLGCSGQDQGLRNVDVSDIHYVGLSGFFQKPTGGNLTLADVANKDIYLITSEDDVNPCPVEYGGTIFISDDQIGQSESFNGNQLADLKAFTFSNVKHLLLGAGNYTTPYKLTDQSPVLGSGSYASNGGCWGDFDNDGDFDLFIPTGRRSGATNDKNQLYLNRGNGTFQEVTTGAVVEDDGNSTGCTCADYDNDGDVDLFVTNDGPNFFYANNGNSTFTRLTAGPIVTDNLKSSGAVWGDYENDGDLDLFVATGNNQRNALYLNLGNGSFTKTDSTNILVGEASSSTGCNWVDYDGDSKVDLFVTNTDNQRNFLYHNLGNGEFEKITSGALVIDNKSSLGASWADSDNDGDLDVLVVNGSGQSHDLYKNNGGGFSRTNFFSSSTSDTAGIGSSWGDFDNDGDVDLFMTTPFGLLMNWVPQDGNFYRTSGYGISGSGGRSCALTDYDSDGHLDYFVARFGSTNLLFHNDGGDNNWLKVRCQGTVSNRSAIGAKVHAKAQMNGRPVWQFCEVSAQTGHSAQNGLEAHFGLGQAQIVDSLVIRWPAGSVNVLTNVAVNQVVKVTEPGTPRPTLAWIRPQASSPQFSGGEFWVDVNIDSVQNLFGVSFDLNYTNTDIIDVVIPYSGNVMIGPFLGNDVIPFSNVDETAGKVSIGISRKVPQSGVSGSGVVARVKFKSLANTLSGTVVVFSLSNVSANDPSGNPILLNTRSDTTVINGGLIVWPGDTNNDGIVNQADVLPVGVHWNKTGPARENASMTWIGQPATPWVPEAATYADGNGNGLVNQAEIQAIGLNWGKTHGVASPVGTHGNHRRLLSSLNPAELCYVIGSSPGPGQEFSVDVLVSGVTDLFGLAFELRYSPTIYFQAQAIEMGQFLGEDVISFADIDSAGGKVSIGVSRKAPERGVSGDGVVARIKMRMAANAPANEKVTIEFRNVTANDSAGTAIPIEPTGSCVITGVTDSYSPDKIPMTFALHQNWPNPFNPTTTVSYDIPQLVEVKLVIFDITGKKVRTLVNQSQLAGRYAITWDGRNEQGQNVASGVFICRMQAGSFSQVMRMALLR